MAIHPIRRSRKQKEESCIRQVKEQNKGRPRSKRVNPFAVCRASLRKVSKNKGF